MHSIVRTRSGELLLSLFYLHSTVQRYLIFNDRIAQLLSSFLPDWMLNLDCWTDRNVKKKINFNIRKESVHFCARDIVCIIFLYICVHMYGWICVNICAYICAIGIVFNEDIKCLLLIANTQVTYIFFYMFCFNSKRDDSVYDKNEPSHIIFLSKQETYN